MAGVVQVPWYATGFRGDAMEKSLAEIAPLALRYGASSFHVYRFREDRYRFLQFSAFESKLDWERYWEGDEFVDWRTRNSSRYQVPVLYAWADLTTHAVVAAEPESSGETLAGGRAQGDTI